MDNRQGVDTDALLSELKKLGAGAFPHRHGSLETHLCGTATLLQQWGASADLVKAGLFHAAYGTDDYPTPLVDLSLRKNIVNIIGEQAEALVYLYCACDRGRFYLRLATENQTKFLDRFTHSETLLTREQLAAFCTLTMANEVDIMLHDSELTFKKVARFHDLFMRMQGLANEAGFTAYEQVLARFEI